MTDKVPIWSLDCETDPFKQGRIPQPFLWGVYQGDRGIYEQFEKTADVSEFLKKTRGIFYAHNGGKFDWHYLRESINSDEKLMAINGRLARFNIGKAECRDSYNILPVPLSAFNKMAIDYTLLESNVRHKPENWKLICDYLKSDCENLWQFVMTFFRTYGISLTQAGAAMDYWQKMTKQKAPRQSQANYDRYRPYYYGGRVQCFESGYAKTRFSVIDINSAYPYAMLSKHPLATQSDTSAQLSNKESVFNTSMVTLDAVARGCFPMRGPDGSLWFPYDEKTVREYHVTGYELAAAMDTNTVKIVKVKQVHTFSQVLDFRDYVNHFYTLRKTAKASGDRAGDVFAKLFLNSLYGKFAANPDKYEEFIISNPDLPKWAGWRTEGFLERGQFGSRWLLSRPIPEAKRRHYNIATAASITGYVRAYLWRSLCACDRPIYCDTDSIAARGIGKLQLGTELGQWKLEAECDQYAIAGKKMYAFHIPKDDTWKYASKGVSLKPAQIIRVAQGEDLTFLPEVPTYTIHKGKPVFINRKITKTYRDISKYPQ